MNVDLCRICLKAEFSEGAHLNDSLNSFTVSEVIISITRVKFLLADDLPNKICSNCLSDLKNVLDFVERCEKSDEFVRKLYLEGSLVKLEAEVNGNEFDCREYNDDCSVKNEDDDSAGQCDEKRSNSFCEVCNEEFADNHSYKTHIKLHRHTYVCDVCKKSFLKHNSLEKHIRTKHASPGLLDDKLTEQDCIEIIGEGKNRVFKCSNCEYKTSRMVHMRAHVVIHSGVKPFHCKMCPKAYTQLGSLQFHMEKVHLNKNLTVPCEVCGKILSSKKHLWSHLKTHSDQEHLCPVCSIRLKNEKTLAQHMSRHSGQKNYSCELCAAAFYTFSELCNHKNSHKGEESMFMCKHCNYKVKRKSLLKTHMIKHGSNLPHTCQLCGRMFSSVHALKIHKKKHSDWKIYKCPICAARFSNTKTVKRHLTKVHNEGWNASLWKALKGSLNVESVKTREIVIS